MSHVRYMARHGAKATAIVEGERLALLSERGKARRSGRLMVADATHPGGHRSATVAEVAGIVNALAVEGAAAKTLGTLTAVGAGTAA